MSVYEDEVELPDKTASTYNYLTTGKDSVCAFVVHDGSAGILLPAQKGDVPTAGRGCGA